MRESVCVGTVVVRDNNTLMPRDENVVIGVQSFKPIVLHDSIGQIFEEQF